MALSVEKLLTDAHMLVGHLRTHDAVANNIIAATQNLYSKFESMKQYQDDITELKDVAKHRPRISLVVGLAQENHQIRELQQENRELQAALEEHQSALELIMQKYREHTIKLLQSNKMEKVVREQDIDKDSVCHLMDKIDEMAGVMQKAIEVDERMGWADEENLSRLEVENRALKELLEICTTSKKRIVPNEGTNSQENVEGDSESDEERTDTECDSSVVISQNKSQEKENEDNKLIGPVDLIRGDILSSAVLNSPDSLSATIMDAILSSNREGAMIPGRVKSLGESKSAGDIRKGETSLADRAESKLSVIKTMSSTAVKKDLK